MKKFLVGCAFVLGGLSLWANDSYLYWLQDTATPANLDGNLFDNTTYTARFVAINGETWNYFGTPLDLYETVDGGYSPVASSFGTMASVNLSKTGSENNLPYFVNLGAISSAAGSGTTSYFIELYNGDELIAHSTTGLTYDKALADGYIYTTGGSEISNPTRGFAPVAFTAQGVPEPTSGLLLLFGLAGLALKRRKQHCNGKVG